LFFSFAGTKLPSYLFPAFPALALLVGGTAFSNFKPIRLWRKNRSTGITDAQLAAGSRQPAAGADQVPRWLDRLGLWLLGLTGGAMAAGFGSVPLILDGLRPLARGVFEEVALPLGVAWWLAGLLAVGSMTALLARGIWRPTALAAMMGLVILTAETAVAPQAYAILQGPLREFVEDARRLLGPRGTLVVYGLNAPSIVFYAGRPVTPLGAASVESLAHIRRLAEADSPVVVITRNVHAPRLNGVPGLFRLKSRGGYAIYCSACQAQGNLKFPSDN
jgi:4-amino-4-deoxy-L-arabinose transferase-like glycosyltransferase